MFETGSRRSSALQRDSSLQTKQTNGGGQSPLTKSTSGQPPLTKSTSGQSSLTKSTSGQSPLTKSTFGQSPLTKSTSGQSADGSSVVCNDVASRVIVKRSKTSADLLTSNGKPVKASVNKPVKDVSFSTGKKPVQDISADKPVKDGRNTCVALNSKTTDVRNQSSVTAEESKTEQRYGSLIIRKSTFNDVERSDLHPESIRVATINNSPTKTLPIAVNGQRDNTRLSSNAGGPHWSKSNGQWSSSDVKATPTNGPSKMSDNDATEINNIDNSIKAAKSCTTQNAVASDWLANGHSVDVESTDQRHSVDVKSTDQRHLVDVKSTDQRHSVDVKSTDQRHSVDVKSTDQQRPSLNCSDLAAAGQKSELTVNPSTGHLGHPLPDVRVDDHKSGHPSNPPVDRLNDHSADHAADHVTDDHLTHLSIAPMENGLSNLRMMDGRSDVICNVDPVVVRTTVAPPGERKGWADGGTDAADGEAAAAAEPEHPYLVRIAEQAVVARPILSPQGTMRGVTNRVRSAITLFREKQDAGKKSVNYSQLEKGKVVFYTTSVTAVRGTFEKCLRVKRVLHTQMVDFEERNIFLSKDLHQQLIERLNQDPGSVLELPQVFVEGYHLGDAEEIERLNETGVLRKIFQKFKKVQHPECCTRCGGYRYTPCNSCHGSKKSRRNYFTKEFCALRCTSCDDNGLVKCEQCNTDNADDNESPLASDSF